MELVKNAETLDHVALHSTACHWKSSHRVQTQIYHIIMYPNGGIGDVSIFLTTSISCVSEPPHWSSCWRDFGVGTNVTKNSRFMTGLIYLTRNSIKNNSPKNMVDFVVDGDIFFLP